VTLDDLAALPRGPRRSTGNLSPIPSCP